MLTEQDILDTGFEKLDYSTDDIQYYLLDVSRSARYQQYDAHNEYILEVNIAASNPHKLQSTLKLAQSFGTNTNSWHGTFTNAAHLYDILSAMLTWDLKH